MTPHALPPDKRTAAPSPRRVPRWLLDVAAGLVVVGVGCAPNPDLPVLSPIDLATTAGSLAALSLLLPLRRRYPTTILVLCVMVAGLAPLWTTSIFGYLAASAIAMFRLADRTNRRRTILLALVSMAILFASTASTQLLGLGYDHILPPLAVIAVAAALGEATRNRRVSMEAITERAVRAEQTRELEAQQRVTEERLRIARELHDAAAHQIAAISLHAGVASHALRTRPDDAERALEIIRASARSVLTEISALLRVLRSAPESADGSPTPPTVNLDALGRLLADFRRSGLQVTKHMDGDLSQVHGAVSFVAYRIIQEALANALKHGADQTADLRVAVSSGLLVIAVTNRVGEQSKDPHALSGHHGLIGVQERVDSVRGTLTLDRGRSGFALRAELPFQVTAPLSKVQQ